MNPFTLFYNKIERLYDKKISSNGLAIFRITWGLVLFFEVREMFIFSDLRFNTIPFTEFYELSFGPILFIWLILSIFIIIGFQTKTVTIINYLMSILFFGNIHSFEYHAFYAYIGINFLLIFLPISKSLSIDLLLNKVKYTKANYTHSPSSKVSVLYYYLPVLIGIAFVYSDSILYKLDSVTWLEGMGVWRPSVLPNFNISGDLFFLNNEFLTKSMGYLTLVFEFIFIFIFYIKKLRWTIFIIGMGLHLGILLVFPIPLFALAVCSIYFLMVPVKTWVWLGNLFKSKEPKITFIYDSECPLCTKTRVVIESIDFFNRINYQSAQTAKAKFDELKNIEQNELIRHIYSVSKKGNVYKGVDTYIQVLFHTILFSPIAFIISLPGIKHFGKYIYNYIAKNREREICNDDHCIIYTAPEEIDENKSLIKGFSLKKIRIIKITILLLFLSFMQLNVSLSSGILKNNIKKTNITNTTFGQNCLKIQIRFSDLSKRFFGITHHPVFSDGHYMNYNNIFALTYTDEFNNEIWLPIIDIKGQPGRYNYGANWVNWTFRVNGTYYNRIRLTKGVIRYSSFWAGKNNKSLDDLHFKIKLKKVKTTKTFEPHFLTKENMNNDWINFGVINWRNKKAEVKLFYELVTEGENDFKKINN